MGTDGEKCIQVISGCEAVEFIFKCVFIGIWQLIRLAVRRLWKGHRRKLSEDVSSIELTVDSSVGRHCYIKIMGVKYHYVETGPKSGKTVLILGDAPETVDLWAPSWSAVVTKFAELGHHVITLDLRGTGASEAGDRSDLSPPRVVRELHTLLKALEVTESKPAIVIGFGIGGMLTWYLAHCYGTLISKFAIISAPHPNLYWQHPPAVFCHRSLYFIQWPYFPERWLAEGVAREGQEYASSRARDWSGALNYVRGAAWYKIQKDHRIQPRCLLIGSRESAAQLVASAQYCTSPALRLLVNPGPEDRDLHNLILDFFIGKQKSPEEVPKGIVGRVIGAVAGRGRELTARLALPANA